MLRHFAIAKCSRCKGVRGLHCQSPTRKRNYAPTEVIHANDFPKMKPFAASLVISSCALSLAACGSTPPPKIGAVDPTPNTDYGQGDYAAVAQSSYRLNASDRIAITVYREPDLSVADIMIGPDGMLAVPLIGAVMARGLTAAELSDVLTRKLADGYLRHPSVSVNMLEYASHVVTVEGAVEKTGVYQFKPGAKLSAALSLANGPNRVAKLDRVAVFRQSAEGVRVARFDYAAIRQGVMMDPVLAPGDRVVVGTSGSAQFWQDVLKAAPVFAVFFNAF